MRNGGRSAWKMCRIAFFVMLLALASMSQTGRAQKSVPTTSVEQPVAQRNSAFPTAKPYTLPPDKLAQATALGRIRPAIHFGAEFWELAVLWLLLATGTATRLGQWAAARTARSWLQSAIFAALLTALVFVVADLPVAAIRHAFSLYYGISIESWPAWLADEAKTLGLIVLLETPLLMLVFGLMRWTWSRRRYWLWFAVAVVPIIVLGTFLLPSLIEPLFDTFEPLAKSHPTLVTELEQVVARTGTSIPPERMFLMKASEKSNGLNAYVTGIGTSKRIVVWDTTADRMPVDEILFTFGHESGHYVLNHIPKGLALGAAGIFVLFWAASRLAQGLVRRFGVSWRVYSVASLPGLAVLLLALAALQTITEPIGNALSRYAEHQADVYGQEAIHGIVPDPQKTAVASFNQLGAAYLDDPNPNPFIELWTYDHPSIQSRAIFAARYNPWAPGQKPQFFQK